MKIYIFFFLILIFPAKTAAEDIDLFELLDTRVSTASKIEEAVLNAPLSVSTITSEMIENFGYETVSEALLGVGGFFGRTDMFYDYVGVRGIERPSSYGGNITLLINGHKINEVVFDAAFYGVDRVINLKSVERIEIVKGPVSSVYGTGSMLAAINIITKNPEKNPGGGVDLTYGSFNSKRIQAFYNTSSGDLDFSINGAVSETDGADHYFPEFNTPETNNGNALGVDWENYWGLYSSISWKDLEFNFFWGDRNKGIPTGAWYMEFNNPAAAYRDRKYFGELKYKNRLSAEIELNIRAGMDDYHYKGVYPYQEETSIDYYDSGTGRVISGNADLTWDINSANRFVGGFEFINVLKSDYRLWTNGDEFLYVDYPYTILSFFAEDSWQLHSNFKLLTGLRYDFYSKDDNSLSPRLTFVYNPFENSSVKLIYGQAYRIPNIYERLYSEAEKAKPNPDLKPEKIHSVELRFEKIFYDKLILDAGLYNNWIDNFISQRLDESDMLAQFVNTELVSVSGVDLVIILKATDATSLQLYYTAQFADNRENSDKIINIPEHIVKLSFTNHPVRDLTVSANIVMESPRETLNGEKTDNIFLVNLYANYRLWFENSFLKAVNFSIKARNIFDLEYSLPGGNEHVQDQLPQAGRNIRFSAGIQI